MKIKNASDITIYWRTFKKDDTAHLIGLADGTLKPGAEGNWSDESYKNFQLEIKVDGVLGLILVAAKPNRLYNINDNLSFGLSK